MKYLSEWDQWKRYSSKSWKRFLEKAREMTAHLELWREDLRSIGGTVPAPPGAPPGAPPQGLGRGAASPSLTSSGNLAFPSTTNRSNTTVRSGRACVFVTRKVTDIFLFLPVVVVLEATEAHRYCEITAGFRCAPRSCYLTC